MGSAAPRLDETVDLGRGLILPTCVTVASGTFGYGFELGRLCPVDRLGAIFTKGTTLQPRAGNLPPRIAETPAGMLNAIGLQNPGVEVVRRDYAPVWRDWPVPVLVNVAGQDIAEYVQVVRRLDGVEGVAGLELNISCPNVAGGLDFGLDPAAAAGCVKAVRGVTDLPLVVKLSPNAADVAAVARAVVDAGADAVSLVNTLVGLKVSLALGRPVLPGTGTGGLSGPAIKPIALAQVARVRRAVGVPIIGIGGIATARDALEFLVVGADAVQVGTATFVDPGAALQVLDGCRAHAHRLGLSAWRDLRWTGPTDPTREGGGAPG
ncbi:MAG TPA: dihydroorotate dehydrogenase [Verrucomicrobiae bacterium]|nr:dihydroorotate dehydrogenase [Verrucomicrobiae bacterium]